MFLDGDKENSAVGGGVLRGNSLMLAREMLELFVTESHKLVYKFGKPHLGHS